MKTLQTSHRRAAHLCVWLFLALAVLPVVPAAAQVLTEAVQPVTDVLTEAESVLTNIWFRIIMSIVIVVGCIFIGAWRGRRGADWVVFGILAAVAFNVAIAVFTAVF